MTAIVSERICFKCECSIRHNNSYYWKPHNPNECEFHLFYSCISCTDDNTFNYLETDCDCIKEPVTNQFIRSTYLSEKAVRKATNQMNAYQRIEKLSDEIETLKNTKHYNCEDDEARLKKIQELERECERLSFKYYAF